MAQNIKIAWGKKLTSEEKEEFLKVCVRLDIHPDFLMACIAFETGETFSPSIKNSAGSNALGLLQFMPTTAAGLGTTTKKLSAMTFIEQLAYVEAYLRPYKGRLKTLSDVYMAILWPAAVGKPEDYILFDKTDVKNPKRYLQNRGLDFNKDGRIVKGETALKIEEKLKKGKRPEYYG